MIATSGNKGKDVRSDCFIQMELTNDGGIVINIKSRVEAVYGEAIKNDTISILDFFNIKNAIVDIEDSGALDFVLAARLEVAISQLIDTKKEFLPDFLSGNLNETTRDRSRISRLYLPGNTPRFMINAGIHKPDGVILDLEDSVAPEKKEEARFLVRNALRKIDFMGAERMVRINQLPAGLKDLEYIVPHHVNLILIPKCEDGIQVKEVQEKINKIKKELKLNNPVWLMPIIESAKGVIHASTIATASETVVALAIGLEDYTADLGVQRTKEGNESFYARSQVVNAAKAAGIQAIDSVFSDVDDLEGLKYNVLHSKALGFEGMGCIHPRQISIIHELYAPDEKEIETAKKIVYAYDTALSSGISVVAIGSKMIDPPVVKRALKIIDVAISLGKLRADWKN